MSDKKWDEVFYFNINSYQFDNNNNNKNRWEVLPAFNPFTYQSVRGGILGGLFQVISEWMLLFLMIFPVGLIKNGGLYLSGAEIEMLRSRAL